MYTESQTLIIDDSLPSLNEFIKALNNNRWGGNTLKQDADYLVEITAKKQKLKTINVPCFVEFHWVCKNKKIDKDNICFAKKFILDGLQKAGILLQDNWKAVDGFSDHFEIDKSFPHIRVVLKY